MSGRRSCLLAGLVLALPPWAHGGPVKGVRSEVLDPIAVRGGVLMVPLGAERAGDGWPRTLELEPVGGRPIAGVVAWVHRADPVGIRGWTHDPRGLAVRGIDPGDDTAVLGSGAPYLLARLPRDGAGPMQLGRQTLHPRWRDPPATTWPPPRALDLAPGPDRPDPESPFEYWRWVLIAERLGREAPPTGAYGGFGSRVAEHYAGLWRLGLARLSRVQPDLAARCRDVLTETCLDGEQPFAVWIVDPLVVGRLLAVLLDFGRGDDELVEAAGEWIELQDLLMVRVASSDPGRPVVAVANPFRESVYVRFTWLGSMALAASVTLEPGVLTRVALQPPPTDTGGVHVLVMDRADGQKRMAFRVGSLPAVPPGLFFSPLRPPQTLAEAQMGWTRSPPADRATLAQLRRRGSRWELFFECRRPPGTAGGPGNLALAEGVRETKGVEAVTILLGGQPADVVLTVPETGWHRLFRGDHDGSLQVHRRSYHDRWFCRIVLPESWLGGPEKGVAQVGLLRTHGDEAMEGGPYAALPWSLDPGRAFIDLSAWDAVPEP